MKGIVLSSVIIAAAALSATGGPDGRAQAAFPLSPGGEAAASQDDAPPFPSEEARAFFPDMRHVTRKHGSLYEVRGKAGALRGYIAFGPPPGTDIRGFGGRVPLLVGLDTQYRIRGVRIHPEHGETPYYAARVLDRLAGAWTDMTPREAAEARIDAVTGATLTSEAIIEGVRETMLALTGEAPLIDGPARAGLISMRTAGEVAALVFLLAALALFFLPSAPARSKLIMKAAAVLIPGVLAATFLYLPLFAVWLRGNFMPARHWLPALIALTAFGIPLLKRRNFYCYNFCPYGAAQDLAGKLNKRKKWRPGRNVGRLLRAAQLLLVSAALVIIVARADVDLSYFEPFVAFRWPFAPWFSRCIALIFLLLAVLVPRPWCRLCPTGGLIEAARNIGLKKKT